MVCKIVFDKKDKLPYQQYETDTGSFFEIAGKIDFINNQSTISCATLFLIRDVYSLFYSVNDFIEFGFASISIGDNTKYNIINKGDEIAIIEINGEKIEVETKSFLSTILKSAYDFFIFLNHCDENKEYQMYLHIIFSLYMKYMPERIKEFEDTMSNLGLK